MVSAVCTSFAALFCSKEDIWYYRYFFKHLFHGFIILLAACSVVPHPFPCHLDFGNLVSQQSRYRHDVTWQMHVQNYWNFCENKVLKSARLTTQFYAIEWIHLLANRCFCTTCVMCFRAAISAFLLLCTLQTCFAATHSILSQGMILRDFALLQEFARVFWQWRISCSRYCSRFEYFGNLFGSKDRVSLSAKILGKD